MRLCAVVVCRVIGLWLQDDADSSYGGGGGGGGSGGSTLKLVPRESRDA